MKSNRYIIIILALLATVTVKAQDDMTSGLRWSMLHNLEYEINAGINIGGTAPIPLPGEIRKIDSYDPNLNLHIGASATKWLSNDKRWGVMVGLRFESKGMKTKATVKNYGMEIIQDGSRVKGNWTGKVQTKYHGNFVTLPISAVYKISQRVRVNFGPYIGIGMNGEFSGYVYDGYLREGDPTGNKVTFEGESQAPYDFSDELRTFQWGLQGGISWRAFKHLLVQGNLSWGFNDIFKKSFNTVTFDLYPIYLNVGFGYAF